ncbi:MAG TPA: S1C family serine protease [Alphaproteobacteria bacterium]|nr:S1C family serine protease [Alphaproteobacteria bacterium]
MTIASIRKSWLRSWCLAATVLLAAWLPIQSAHAAAAKRSLDEILNAVVRVMATVPADARTARALGRERAGNGILIDSNGLVLTIGYLILEADKIVVMPPGEKATSARFIAYDHETGLGLIRTARKLKVKPMPMGDSRKLKPRDTLVVSGFGGRTRARPAMIVSRRDFAGYWEYLLEGAIFTAPIYRNFGGAALIGLDGTLVGVGSLAVPDAGGPGRRLAGNMFIPIEKLKPILADLLTHGRSQGPRRPWLGAFTREGPAQQVLVVQVTPDGPAAKAGIKPGDLVSEVAGRKIAGQLDFYRKLWAAGKPGVKIAITISRGAQAITVTVTAGDRYRWLKMGKRG